MSEKPDDELIDRRLEFLYQRMVRAEKHWAANYQSYTEQDFRRFHQIGAAYLCAVYRYDREAPTIREWLQQENAAWN